MRRATAIRKEYKAVCQKMDELMEKGRAAGCHGPITADVNLYTSLYHIRITLEWIHPKMIKTELKGPQRLMELAGYKHYVAGPLHATLYP